MAGDEEHDVRPGELVVVRCGFCGGRGIYPFGHPPSQAQCGVCKGRGWVYVVALYVLCPVCDGTYLRLVDDLPALRGQGSDKRAWEKRVNRKCLEEFLMKEQSIWL